jgi:hypothetical protein
MIIGTGEGGLFGRIRFVIVIDVYIKMCSSFILAGGPTVAEQDSLVILVGGPMVAEQDCLAS